MSGAGSPSPATIEAAVRTALDGLGVPYEVIACDPAFADTAAFCERYGYAPEISANAIVVASKREPKQYAVCLVAATARLDVNGVVRRLLGVRKCSFATPEETAALTGMLIGGVTPFALPPDLPLFVDATLMRLERVVVGGGSRSCKIALAPQVFTRTPHTRIVEGLSLPASRPV